MIYFISDIHWGARWSNVDHALRRRAIEGFIDIIKDNAKEVYLVGDTFDFWFEYKHSVPRLGLEIIRLLKKLTDVGCKITILDGNHDFALGQFLKDQGFIVACGPIEISLNEYKVYISHGDELMTDDKGYMLLKSLVRSKPIGCLFRFIPSDIGLPLAYRFSSISHLYTEHKKLKPEFYLNVNKLAASRYKVLLLGHYHYPIYEGINNDSHLFFLGDWIKNFSFVTFDGTDLSLQRMKIVDDSMDFEILKTISLTPSISGC